MNIIQNSRYHLTALMVVLIIALFTAGVAFATEQIADETGYDCSYCHLDPAGGGELTPAGTLYLEQAVQAGSAKEAGLAVKLFRLLAKKHDLTFLFFSDASEKNWESLNPHGIDEVPIVPLHSPKAGKITVLFRIARQLWSNPYDVFIQGISGRFVVPLTYIIARIRKKPFILWTGFWNHPTTFFHVLTFPIVRHIYRKADALVVYGAHVRDYLVSLGVNSDKIFIAWNTADNELYNKTVTDIEHAELRESLDLAEKVQQDADVISTTTAGIYTGLFLLAIGGLVWILGPLMGRLRK